MYKPLNDAQIQKVVESVCKANGVASFAKQITWQWSGKMSSEAGIAKMADNSLCLSQQLMPMANAAAQKEVVGHNVCHLIAWKESNHMSHGKPWKDCMLAAGYDTDKKAPIDNKKLKRKSVHKFSCGCDKRPFTLGPTMAKRIIAKVCAYKCAKCNRNYKLAKGA